MLGGLILYPLLGGLPWLSLLFQLFQLIQCIKFFFPNRFVINWKGLIGILYRKVRMVRGNIIQFRGIVFVPLLFLEDWGVRTFVNLIKP